MIEETLFSHVFDILFDSIKERISGNLDQRKLKREFDVYLAQEKKHLEFESDVEFDYGAILEYVHKELMRDISRYLFGGIGERRRTRKEIQRKAVNYSHARSKSSIDKINKLIKDILDVSEEFYRKKLKKPELYFVNRAVDDITDSISSNAAEVKNYISHSSRHSLDSKVESISNGDIEQLESTYQLEFDVLSSQHVLSQYYRVERQNGHLVSVAKNDDAKVLYPQTMKIQLGNISIINGDDETKKSPDLSEEIINYSYYHQKPITAIIASAESYLGEIRDPFQSTAKSLIGAEILLTPAKLSEQYTCACVVEDEILYNLLLQVDEEFEDGKIRITNSKQINPQVSVEIIMDQNTNDVNYKFTPLYTTNEQLISFYQKMIKLLAGVSISFQLINNNQVLIDGRINPDLAAIERYKRKIEFTKKVITIGKHFCEDIVVKGSVTSEDVSIVYVLYQLISEGSLIGTWRELPVSDTCAHLKKSTIYQNKQCSMDRVVNAGKYSYYFWGKEIIFYTQKVFDVVRVDDLTNVLYQIDHSRDEDIIEYKLMPLYPAAKSGLFSEKLLSEREYHSYLPFAGIDKKNKEVDELIVTSRRKIFDHQN